MCVSMEVDGVDAFLEILFLQEFSIIGEKVELALFVDLHDQSVMENRIIQNDKIRQMIFVTQGDFFGDD